jgi:hypothetical protein
MAPLPPAENILRVSVRGNNSGPAWANVFHVEMETGSPSTDDLNTFCEDFAGAYHTNLMPHLENELALTDVVATDLTANDAPQGSWSGLYNGGYAGQPYPAQVSVCISWKQALRFRGGHPRTYLAAIPLASGADNHNLNATYKGYYLAGASAFRAAVNALNIGAQSVQLVMLSYYHNKALRPTPLPYALTGEAVHGRLDTQRRRLGREAA